MPSIETQTDEEFTLFDDENCIFYENNIKFRNNTYIFYSDYVNVSGNTQETMTEYNSVNELIMNNIIKSML